MADSIDRVFVHALNTVKRIPRTGTARPPTAERLKLYGLYKQSMEGDVEGVMDRPAGNTTDVYAECEKWDAWFAQRGLSRTEAKRRYISTLIETMHRYASQTPEARELVAELEFVWDQIKANTSSGSESAMSSPVRTLGVPPLSPQQQQQQQQRPPPPAWRNQSQNHHQQRTYASIGGRLAQQQQPAAYEDMVAIVNANERPGRGETSSRLRVLSPVSQPDDMYQRRSSGVRNYDEDGDEDGGDEGGRNMDEKEDDDEEEEYEEAQDTLYEDDDNNIHHDDENNTQHTTSEDREDYTEEASSIQQHHGKNTPPMTPPPSNRKPSSSAAAAKHQPPPNARRWRRRVEQALTKMTAEIAAVREQMEVRAVQHRRRSSAWAWIKWLAWVALRQVFWDLAVLAMLLIWMRIKGDRRVEEKLKAGWSELKGKLGRLRFLRSMPRVGMLP